MENNIFILLKQANVRLYPWLCLVEHFYQGLGQDIKDLLIKFAIGMKLGRIANRLDKIRFFKNLDK